MPYLKGAVYICLAKATNQTQCTNSTTAELDGPPSVSQ